MGRKIPTEKGLQLLGQCVALCAELAEQDARMEERRHLWREAFDEGCSAKRIAEACDVSENLVYLEVSRARGRPWATASSA